MTLRRGRTASLTYCPAEAPDPHQPGPVLESRDPDRRRHEPLAAFVHARLDADHEGTAGHGTSWRHHPPRSGTVLDDHDEAVVHTRRDIATHLDTWDPPHAWANIESRRLIMDLFEAAPTGSVKKDALRETVRALAMAYRDHPDFDPAWLLREWLVSLDPALKRLGKFGVRRVGVPVRTLSPAADDGGCANCSGRSRRA